MAGDPGELFQNGRVPLHEGADLAQVLAAVRQVQNDINVMTVARQRDTKTMSEIKDLGDELREGIGWSKLDEHGNLIGIGVRGDLARLSQKVDGRFQRYDAVARFAAGVAAAVSISGIGIWWLIEGKLGEMLR